MGNGRGKMEEVKCKMEDVKWNSDSYREQDVRCEVGLTEKENA
jgi:hypothetical protein